MKKGDSTEVKSRPRKADSTTEAPSKVARILAHLLTGASLNRFEAKRMGDHCLNSTVSDLANDYGLNVPRQAEKVPNRWGLPCRVIRYSLPAAEHDRAALVLAHIRKAKREG
jgi:hypothetical protein